MQLDYLNTTTAFYFETECINVRVCACHNTFVLQLALTIILIWIWCCNLIVSG